MIRREIPGSARLLLFVPLLCLHLTSENAGGAGYPSAEISNGVVTAKLYLPDPEAGYYRGTRFDWSGVIHSLVWNGHEYFGEWQTSDDPRKHDRITGPVEEFRNSPGYEEAPVGGTFLRIGVGFCEKPQEAGFRWMNSYRVVDSGKWTVTRGENWVEFVHEVGKAGLGHAYRYTKRVTLPPGSSELVLEHTLASTGAKAIETDVYNHNFFVIDGQPTGPDFVVSFPFALRADQDLRDAAAVRGGEFVYLKEVPRGGSVFTHLEGYGLEAAHNTFSIENRRTKAAVAMATDRPLSKLQIWSARTTLCPEPHIDLKAAPGASEKWTTRYKFYEVR